MSEALRNVLQVPELFAFDAAREPCRIDRITVDYHRMKKVKPNPAIGPGIDYITTETTEWLLIDQATHTIEIYRKK